MSTQNSLTCAVCFSSIDSRASVCPHCRYEIVRGATARELNQASVQWFAAGFILTTALLELIPILLNEKFGWSLPRNFGLHGWAALIAPITIGSISAWHFRLVKAQELASKVRFFRPST